MAAPPAPERGKPSQQVATVETVYLDPREITWPDRRITSRYDQEDAEALGRSLQDQGQQAAVIVRRVEGEWIGVDGYNRCRAAVASGEASVRCEVREGTMRDVLQSNIATALLRGRTNPRDVVEVLAIAHLEEGLTLEEIAKTSGRSMEWAEDMVGIGTRASPAVLQALGDELITVGHARLLSRIEERNLQERGLQAVLSQGLTVGGLEEWMAAEDAPPGTPEVAENARRGRKERGPSACAVCGEKKPAAEISTVSVCGGCQGTLGSSRGEGATHELPLRGEGEGRGGVDPGLVELVYGLIGVAEGMTEEGPRDLAARTRGALRRAMGELPRVPTSPSEEEIDEALAELRQERQAVGVMEGNDGDGA